MAGMVMIEGVNLGLELAISAEDVVYAFTDWFDEFGEECSKEEAIIGIATDGQGWICIDLRKFTRKLS